MSLPSTLSSSELPAPTPSFAWSNFPSTLTTCTSATLRWKYSGSPDVFQFALIPQAQTPPSTTIANGIDSTALTWTWPKVNVSAGAYLLNASGTWITSLAGMLTIVDGTDTSCLAAAAITATTSTTLTTHSPVSSTTPTQTASGRKTTNVGAIAGGAVAGVVVLIITLLGYRVWARRRRPRLTRTRHPPEAAHRDLLSPYLASGTEAPSRTEKGTRGADPSDDTALTSPPVPNRRQPSPSSLSEPYTPAPSYTSQAHTRERAAGSIMDVSTIASRSSAAFSDTTSTAGLIRTNSSCCPPSYLTSPSPPPSYVTRATRGAATSRSRSPHLIYARSPP